MNRAVMGAPTAKDARHSFLAKHCRSYGDSKKGYTPIQLCLSARLMPAELEWVQSESGITAKAHYSEEDRYATVQTAAYLRLHLDRYRSDEGNVYFIVASDETIKIGYSKNPERRRLELEAGKRLLRPLRLAAVIPGVSIFAEQFVHACFRPALIGREWFRPSPELLTLIATFAGRCL